MPKYVVRHGVMRNLGVFYTKGNDTHARGQQVIARTHRGLEAGEVLCEATDEAVVLTAGQTDAPFQSTVPDDADLEIFKLTAQATGGFRWPNSRLRACTG